MMKVRLPRVEQTNSTNCDVIVTHCPCCLVAETADVIVTHCPCCLVAETAEQAACTSRVPLLIPFLLFFLLCIFLLP